MVTSEYYNSKNLANTPINKITLRKNFIKIRHRSSASMLAVRLKWLLFLFMVSSAVILTVAVLTIVFSALLAYYDRQLANAVNNVALFWLPQRSLIPRLCFTASDCNLLISGTDLRPNVAVLIVATGHYYTRYVKTLLKSSRKFFCKSCRVHYFIFTDSTEIEKHLPKLDWPDVDHLRQQQLGWPFDVMARFSMYRHFYSHYKNFDYIVSMDADLVFINHVERELLGDLVGVLHHGFYNVRGTYEEAHGESMAYVEPFEGTYYFTSGLWSASSSNFAKLVKRLSYTVDEDLRRGIVATWYDESHLNRYFIDHQPTTILSSVYHFPANRRLIAKTPDKPKILALNNKTYNEVRLQRKK